MVFAGTLLGDRYQLDQPIGSGGYSEVWRASDTVLFRPVAVKLLHPGYAEHAEALARFQAEARHAGALAHQNIARVYDYGEPAGEQPFLVMELVEGPSLAHALTRGPLDAARSMDVIAQAASGLQAAHAEGLIHRDIKPANLLLAPGGTVKITDFGIAHAVGSAPITLTGMLLGTPGYLAPNGQPEHGRLRPATCMPWASSLMNALPVRRPSPARRWRSPWPTGTSRCLRCPPNCRPRWSTSSCSSPRRTPAGARTVPTRSPGAPASCETT
jgi:serine/threonine protein kinase